ncbi:hypothetical protein QYF36_026147 [Acer negundo]|nr:hypothetical protein QYF36_026147 [Acer negundo]
MERRIYEAAVEGSVISLLNLLQEDPLVLDRFMVGCYPETPLHIASMLGHLDFVQEILNRKPEMAGELDARKSSPLHLATAKGYLEIVKKLVSVNPEMCFARDRDGRNPLHIATIKGHFSVLKELVNVRPQAAPMSIDDRGETILHLCVRYSQLEILKLLVETIGDNGFLNSKCHDGNTILHTAASDKQLEKRIWLHSFRSFHTIQQKRRKRLGDCGVASMLWSKATKDIPLSAHELGTTQMARTLTSHENDHNNNALQPKNEGCGNVDEKKNDWVEKISSALMIVASLIATMAFQVAVNPPGFLASLSIILLLISGLPIGRKFFMWILMVIMWIAISAMSFTYALAISSLSNLKSMYNAVRFVIIAGIGLMGLLVLVHTILLIVKMIKYVKKSTRQRRQPSGNMA